MNLYDLVSRSDRSIISQEKITPSVIPTSVGNFRSIEIPSNSNLCIADAHEFSCLHILSRDLGWALLIKNHNSKIIINILSRLEGNLKVLPVSLEYIKRSEDVVDIRLDWPIDLPRLAKYDIQIINPNPQPLNLLSGEVRDIRKYAAPLLKGKGIEVGPGLRPAVLPTPEIEVSYIEQVHPRDWSSLYNKSYQEIQLPEKHLLDRYVCDNASLLDSIGDHSLDFIFSSHVFEHLHNPLMVIGNWLKKLKSGGFIISNIPDARYTFDARQPISTLINIMEEERMGDHVMPRAKYEQWAKYTAPHQTAEQFIQRNYPIHAHYYTPESLHGILRYHQDRSEGINHIFMHTLKNNKDFFVAIQKI